MNSAMVAATMLIAPLGSIAIAANSFAVTAEGLCYMPGYGIGSAATTLVGRSYGAGNYKLAKRYGNICIAMGAVLMAITGGLMMIFCPFVELCIRGLLLLYRQHTSKYYKLPAA